MAGLSFTGTPAEKVDFTSFWLNSKSYSTSKHDVLDENVVFHDLFKNKNMDADFRKASTVFMVRLFNGIHKTESLAKAAGQTWEKPGFKLSDTIRSFSAKGIFHFIFFSIILLKKKLSVYIFVESCVQYYIVIQYEFDII